MPDFYWKHPIISLLFFINKFSNKFIFVYTSKFVKHYFPLKNNLIEKFTTKKIIKNELYKSKSYENMYIYYTDFDNIEEKKNKSYSDSYIILNNQNENEDWGWFAEFIET